MYSPNLKNSQFIFIFLCSPSQICVYILALYPVQFEDTQFTSVVLLTKCVFLHHQEQRRNRMRELPAAVPRDKVKTTNLSSLYHQPTLEVRRLRLEAPAALRYHWSHRWLCSQSPINKPLLGDLNSDLPLVAHFSTANLLSSFHTLSCPFLHALTLLLVSRQRPRWRSTCTRSRSGQCQGGHGLSAGSVQGQDEWMMADGWMEQE